LPCGFSRVELDPLVSELFLFFFDFLFELPDELLSVFELLFAAELLCDPFWEDPFWEDPLCEDPVWEDPPPGVDPPGGVVCPPFWATSAEAAKKNVKKAVFIMFPFLSPVTRTQKLQARSHS
jgi:hypothetical protein